MEAISLQGNHLLKLEIKCISLLTPKRLKDVLYMRHEKWTILLPVESFAPLAQISITSICQFDMKKIFFFWIFSQIHLVLRTSQEPKLHGNLLFSFFDQVYVTHKMLNEIERAASTKTTKICLCTTSRGRKNENLDKKYSYILRALMCAVSATL